MTLIDREKYNCRVQKRRSSTMNMILQTFSWFPLFTFVIIGKVQTFGRASTLSATSLPELEDVKDCVTIEGSVAVTLRQ
jgi:hypothetical protein